MNGKCLADRELQTDAAIAAKPEELVELLRLAGVEGVELATVRRHVAAGCPVGPDGRIDLVAYLAWLLTDEGACEPTEPGP